MLARLCSIPTNDVAMASIVLLRHVAHSVAPALQRPPIEILDHLRVAHRPSGDIRLTWLHPTSRPPRDSADVLPD